MFVLLLDSPELLFLDDIGLVPQQDHYESPHGVKAPPRLSVAGPLETGERRVLVGEEYYSSFWVF